MDWEYIGAVSGRFFLALLEYTFKGFALLAAGISLGTVSGFEQKFTAGFTSLTAAIRDAFEVPSELIQQASIINDYNSMPASLSTEAHSTYNVDTVFAYFGSAIDYFSRVGESFSNHFFSSISAAILLFGIFYLLAWVLRFARQKGQGSWKVQLERKLAEKVFKVPQELAQVPSPQPTPEKSQPEPKPSKFKRQLKINSNGVKKSDSKKEQPKPEQHEKKKFESDPFGIESQTKLKAVPRTNGNGSTDAAKIENGKSFESKSKAQKSNLSSPPPPPNRDEPDWLTNARTSTKEYRQAKAAES